MDDNIPTLDPMSRLYNLQDLRASPHFYVSSYTHKALCYKNVQLLYLINKTHYNR